MICFSAFQGIFSDPFRRLDHFLRSTARELQSWSAKKIGHIKTQLLVAREVILWLDREQDRRSLLELEANLRKELKWKCLGLASLERTIARQRSRVLELKEGDANTRYFHLRARGRRRKNHITSISVGDRRATTHDEMADLLHDYFLQILGQDTVREATLNFGALQLPQTDLEGLDADFSEEEVWAVIKEMPPDKAPGPDGFTGSFYKTAWPVIRGDVMWAINSSFSSTRDSFRCVNNGLIVLLPKKADAKEARDYRPIALIHSFAKLISKLLANRLAPKLAAMIGSNQSAFIKGHSIHDNFFVRQ